MCKCYINGDVCVHEREGYNAGAQEAEDKATEQMLKRLKTKAKAVKLTRSILG